MKKIYLNKINKKNLEKDEINFLRLIILFARYKYEKHKEINFYFNQLKKEILKYNPKKTKYILEKKKILNLFSNQNKNNLNSKLDSYLKTYFEKSINLNDFIYFFKKKLFFKNSYILLIGTDGSGKTTLAKSFKKLFYYKVGYNYFGMGKDNWSNQFYKKIFFNLEKENNFFLKIILIFEFIFRKLKYIYKNRWNIIFVDRILIFSYLQNNLINSFLRMLYPKFDAVIYLHGDLKKIIKRKNDTNYFSAQKNIIKINQLLEKMKIPSKRILKINTTKNNIKKTKQIIFNYLLKNMFVIKNLLN